MGWLFANYVAITSFCDKCHDKNHSYWIETSWLFLAIMCFWTWGGHSSVSTQSPTKDWLHRVLYQPVRKTNWVEEGLGRVWKILSAKVLECCFCYHMSRGKECWDLFFACSLNQDFQPQSLSIILYFSYILLMVFSQSRDDFMPVALKLVTRAWQHSFIKNVHE